jgi:hypothetical protein
LGGPYPARVLPPGRNPPPVAIQFREPVWEEEVGRLDERAPARVQAERARREIEDEKPKLEWLRCDVEGSDRTSLPGCRKLYVPLDADRPSAAPFGFVFRLTRNADDSLSWNLIAFGERHPENRNTRSVYERAHKRLHGHYP